MKRILVIFMASILLLELISCGSFTKNNDVLKRAGTQQPQKANTVSQWTSKKKQNESTTIADTKTFSPTDNLVNTETPINNQIQDEYKVQEEYIDYQPSVKMDDYEPESIFIPTQEEEKTEEYTEEYKEYEYYENYYNYNYNYDYNYSDFNTVQTEEKKYEEIVPVTEVSNLPIYTSEEDVYIPFKQEQSSVADIINSIGTNNYQTDKQPVISDSNTNIEHENSPATSITTYEDDVDNSKVMLFIILGAIFLIGIAIAYYCILLKKRNLD